MMFSASAARCPACAVLQALVITASIRVLARSMGLSSVRRKSPSVKMPARRPCSSMTAVKPRPLRVISSRASFTDVCGLTWGKRSPLCMMSSTLSSKRRPRAPPGCEKAKSSAVKPRASNKAIASASPSTSATVVDEVGAKLSGQASSATRAFSAASALRASAESGLPVMLISGIPKRLISGSRVTISLVEPELDRAITTSSLVIMPMSPWLASAGCTKNAGVPVLARVAASLLPMCPDLPMPTTTTRPAQAKISSHARIKCWSICSRRSLMASRSRAIVRCADSKCGCVWLMVLSATIESPAVYLETMAGV